MEILRGCQVDNLVTILPNILGKKLPKELKIRQVYASW
jgi:hypothetical protein